MIVSVRLDEELERLLAQTATLLGARKSEIIKRSLREYCVRVLQQEIYPYGLIEDLLGREGSGRGDLSTKGRKYIMERLNAKRLHRHR